MHALFTICIILIMPVMSYSVLHFHVQIQAAYNPFDLTSRFVTGTFAACLSAVMSGTQGVAGVRDVLQHLQEEPVRNSSTSTQQVEESHH